MGLYRVNVTRNVVQYRDLKIEAASEEEAKDLAYDQAVDEPDEWSEEEKHVDSEAEAIKPMNTDVTITIGGEYSASLRERMGLALRVALDKVVRNRRVLHETRQAASVVLSNLRTIQAKTVEAE